jgi:hypothetical protein
MPPKLAPPEIAFTSSKNYEPAEDPWQSINDSRWHSTGNLLAPSRTPTPLERQAITEVHELVLRFASGDCSLAEVQAATTPRQRNLATRFTTPKDVAWQPLMQLLNALIEETQGVVLTSHGAFLLSDLWPMRVIGNVLHLPIRWPWRTKPDAERGVDGERGEPVYRHESGPTYGSFSRVPAAEIVPHEPEWWQSESSNDVPF